jgi:hypothetical protein
MEHQLRLLAAMKPLEDAELQIMNEMQVYNSKLRVTEQILDKKVKIF